MSSIEHSIETGDLPGYPALLQSVIQSETVAISVLRPLYNSQNEIEDFVWIMANKLLRAHAGGTSVVGKRFADVFPHSGTNGVLERLKITFTTGARQQDEVYHEDHNVKSWLRQVYTRTDDYIILSAEDVTLSRKADELRAINAKLRTMDSAKTRFFDNVSHEFRTPLTLMMGPLRDFITNNADKLSTGDISTLKMVTRNAMRVHKLVNTLLDFSRIEAGKLDALFQPTDIGTFTRDIASNFRTVIEAAGLKFVVETDEPDERIYINRDMWEKIVLNLLSNAFKFTPHGRIEIKLRSKRLGIQLSVKDTGVGISKRNLPRIFERFVKLENNHGRTYEGSGIGLALVKELVQIHHGLIKVKSKEGEGSIFSVTLKRGKDHLHHGQILEAAGTLSNSEVSAAYIDEASGWLPEAIQTAHVVKKATGSRRAAPTVFVIDDNADMREYLTHVLAPHYHVIPFANGRPAFNFLLKGFYPDLIISDVMMPDMDGYDLVGSIKSNTNLAHIPVILLSARSGEHAVVEAMGMGADDYLEKPFSSRELLAFVKARILLNNNLRK